MNNIKSYNEFKKYFGKREQVCIGGIDWETHGYITQIDEHGIVLNQLHNAKEIRYGWNNFEIIYHAGIRVKSANEYDMADIFTIKLIKQSNYELLTSIPLIQSVEKSSRVGFISFGDFILKSTEVYLKNGKLKVKIRGYEGSVDLYLSGKEVVLYPTETVIMSTLCNKVSCIAIEGGYSFQSIVLSSQESLDNFRNEKEISFQSMGSGDPYIYEGRFVSDQVVETTQGYVFLNEHADIYLETEIKG